MADRISVGQLYPSAMPPGAVRKPASAPAGPPARPFHDILQDRVVRLSHHAEMRLQQRGIQLKPEQLTKIESAVDQAAAKGSKDSLLLMNGMALIVNVTNRTIVTAMDGSSMKDNVFTQIDSAVIIS